MVKTNRYKECIMVLLMAAVVAMVTCFPYLQAGVTGKPDDVTYHLLRVESVKDALAAGQYPARVNPLFFGGYGYGSSLFYPDLFLVIPALMRIVGLSPLLSWKAFVLLLAAANTVSAYLCFKYICRDGRFAAAGAFLLVLSQYYLADLMNRAGISEYLACVFLPMLLVGIYDFFAGRGRKTYLMGVAFVGMLLSHTLMTVVALLVTVLVFLGMVFVPLGRSCYRDKEKMLRLAGTAVICVLLVSYYVFPMLEQMAEGQFWYEKPWADIGKYTQPLSAFFRPIGYFMYVAYIGIGIPILILLLSRVLLGRPRNRWADFFLFGGIALFLAMTDLLPWKLLSRTFLNMLQFTFRFYPIALCFTCLGLTMYLAEKCHEKALAVTGIIIAASVLAGIWQNVDLMRNLDRMAVNEELLAENTGCVGEAEWLPLAVSKKIREGTDFVIRSSAGDLELTVEGYNDYSFVKENMGADTYILPLIYYKGYAACLDSGDGTETELEVTQSEGGLVQLQLEETMQGTVKVRYAGTAVQRVSNLISLTTLAGVIGVTVYRAVKAKRRQDAGSDERKIVTFRK